MSTSHNEASEQPSGSVRQIDTLDGVVLLDIRRNLCLGMTPVGAEIWNLIKEGSSVDQIIDQISVRFGVRHEQVAEDVREFLVKLREHGLLETSRKAPDSNPKLSFWVLRVWKHRQGAHSIAAGRFLFCKAIVGLFVFDLLHLEKAFDAMYQFVRQWPVRECASDPRIHDRVSMALNCACVWYPKRVLCLQRSAVLTCLLRSCGVPAEMVMGAQRFPFKAHAWTEVNGRAINERRDVAAIYQVWERC